MVGGVPSRTGVPQENTGRRQPPTAVKMPTTSRNSPKLLRLTGFLQGEANYQNSSKLNNAPISLSSGFPRSDIRASIVPDSASGERW